ncbi:MAG: imidazole glycerol phosphate synthase subunit HisF [Bdellovibrionaceae bacterium]|jgi:imidazole glycerol-phosphate synthase subunit HisF|nr:imidazole glycerol phosphate synthase subunit HisF [Pseudobdellovibrionaceae bacterium]
MLTKRIIPCLDVKDGQVVKGTKFRNHEVLGDISELALKYSEQGADELVFYDITASSDQRTVDAKWVKDIAQLIDIPFCVAGGIISVDKARFILNSGADKISINSPALEHPNLISEMAKAFGSQCVVVGVDSIWHKDDYYVYKYTGDEAKTENSKWRTLDWVKQVQALGAGEVVLNCMSSDGTRDGFDVKQLKLVRELLNIPLVASGGAGKVEHFSDVFQKTNVDAALAAGIFHRNEVSVQQVKEHLSENGLPVR